MRTSARPSQIVARVTTALLGGYAFTWGCAALAVSGMAALGVAYGHAYTAAMLFAFLIFLGAFLWSFTAVSVTRVWLTLVGGAAESKAA